MSESSKELIIQTKTELIELFQSKDGLKPVLERLRTIAKDFDPDIDSKAGREFIASQAYAVSKSKTYLDNLGKELTQEWRDKTANVNSSRTAIKEFCDNLRDEIRKPLTEFEELEKKRNQELERKITELIDIKSDYSNRSEVSIMQKKYEELDAMDIENDGWGEFEFKAFKYKDQAMKHLRSCIDEKIQYDKDQEEIIKLREIAEKARIAEEKRIAEENEKLRIEKEAKIEAEKIEIIRREESEKAEKEKMLELEKKELERKAELERVEIEKNQEIKKAEQARIEKEESEKRLKESQERIALMEKEARERAEKENLAKQKILDDERENKRIVHNIILDSLVKSGIDEETSKKIITLIGKNLIPNISISYAVNNLPKIESVQSEVVEKSKEVKRPSFKL